MVIINEARHENTATLLLRIGLASIFFYAAIASLLRPFDWIGYIPQFLRNIFPGYLLLNLFSAYELILGVWILWGKYVFYSSLLAAATMFSIILLNLGQFDIVFRDIAILFSALALAVLYLNKKS